MNKGPVITALIFGFLFGRCAEPTRVEVRTVKVPIIQREKEVVYEQRDLPAECSRALVVLGEALQTDAVLTQTSGEMRAVLHEAGKAIVGRDLPELNRQYERLRSLDPRINESVVDRAEWHLQVRDLLELCEKGLGR